MKKLILAAATAALALSALTGCGSQPSENMEQTSTEVDQYIGVCMDAETQNRVEDSKCDDESPRYNPYFYAYGATIPGLGYPMMGGYPTIIAPYFMGFSSTGGSSTNYQARTPMAYPKGYVAPPNPVYKKSTPSSAPPKTVDEAKAKYAAPKSSSSTGSGSSTGSKSGSTTTKSNPYSYKGKTSTKSGSSSKSSSSSRK
jgi:hypothetical protein